MVGTVNIVFNTCVYNYFQTGQTPTNNSLLNYWLEEEVSHSDAAGDKHDGEKVKSVSKKRSQLKTPCRRPR